MFGTVFLLVTLFLTMGKSIDYLPCTEGVDAASMALAERLLQQSTPPGYRLIEHSPITQTGRNPHRWICRFERLDNVYRHQCDYLTAVRTEFKKRCPLGCEISQIAVSESPNKQYISVEYLVNCGCVKTPRRKRSFFNRCGNFMTEISTCSGFPN